MRRLSLALVLAQMFVAPFGAQADMLISDLTEVDASSFAPPEFAVRQEEPARMTIACMTCDGLSAIDVLLSPGPKDGTEERIRSGQTTAATMLDLCRKNAGSSGAQCHDIAESNLKGAVGFVSDVTIGDSNFIATRTLYQDGSLLVIRSIANNRDDVRRLSELAFERIAPQIVR